MPVRLQRFYLRILAKLIERVTVFINLFQYFMTDFHHVFYLLHLLFEIIVVIQQIHDVIYVMNDRALLRNPYVYGKLRIHSIEVYIKIKRQISI